MQMYIPYILLLGTLTNNAWWVEAFVPPQHTTRSITAPATKSSSSSLHTFGPLLRSSIQKDDQSLRKYVRLDTKVGGDDGDDVIVALYTQTAAGIASKLTPFRTVLDDTTDGWASTYADLSPETESTPAGIVFLLTNLAYAAAGILLAIRGDALYGFLTELAGIVSFLYHFGQLKLGPEQAPVRVALLVDYVTAGAACICTGVYLCTFPQGFGQIPTEALVVGALSVASLGLSWVWEFGRPYLFWHSMWHLLSAYSGYVVGQAHIQAGL